MIRFNVQSIDKTVPQLTQAGRIGETLNLSESIRIVNFTRTLYATPTKDELFTAGVGNLDPVMYTRVFLQYAFEQKISMSGLVQDFQTFIGTLAHSRSFWPQIAGFITGNATRIVDASKLAAVYGDFVIAKVRELLAPEHDIFTYIISDYVMQQLASSGLAVEGAPYAWRVACPERYLDFKGVVNVVAGARLRHVLSGLTGARSDALRAQISTKRVINPVVLASYLEEGAMTAYDRVGHTYDAERVSIAALVTLAKTWDDALVTSGSLAERIANKPELEELKVNLGLFMAYQDMVRLHKRGSISATLISAFSDEELANEVLPFFKKALSEIAVHRVVPLSDAVSTAAMISLRRHDGFPGHQVVYEDWDVSGDAIAFVPARISKSNPARYLDVDVGVTDKLTAAMKPIVQAMSMKHLAANRIAAYELQFPGDIGINGCEMTIALPSMVERLIGINGDLEGFNKAIGLAEDSDNEAVRNALYQSYAHLVHIAVVRAQKTSIHGVGAAIEGEEDGTLAGGLRQLAIAFTHEAHFNELIGKAAIRDRVVVTMEPIEAIAYSRDFAATSVIKAESFRAMDLERRLHVWDWRRSSRALTYASTFVTSIRGRNYATQINETKLLGEASARPRLHYMGSKMANVLALTWCEWMLTDHKYLTAQAKKVKDKVEAKMYEGAAEALAMEIMTVFSRIGGSGFGASIARTIDASLRDQMIGTKFSDDRSDIRAGIQRAGIQYGAGSIALEFLGLLDVTQTAGLRQIVSSSNAMAVFAATQFNVLRESQHVM